MHGLLFICDFDTVLQYNHVKGAFVLLTQKLSRARWI
jgi:hypothetical protein